MQSFWITFEDGTRACCQGQNDYDAMTIAEERSGKLVKAREDFEFNASDNPNIQPLPYPANPMIWEFEHPLHGATPHFCYRPNECAGKSSCPRNPSCVE